MKLRILGWSTVSICLIYNVEKFVNAVEEMRMKKLCSVALLFMLLTVPGCNGIKSEQKIELQMSSEYLSIITDSNWTLQEMTIDGVNYSG